MGDGRRRILITSFDSTLAGRTPPAECAATEPENRVDLRTAKHRRAWRVLRESSTARLHMQHASPPGVPQSLPRCARRRSSAEHRAGCGSDRASEDSKRRPRRPSTKVRRDRAAAAPAPHSACRPPIPSAAPLIAFMHDPPISRLDRAPPFDSAWRSCPRRAARCFLCGFHPRLRGLLPTAKRRFSCCTTNSSKARVTTFASGPSGEWVGQSAQARSISSRSLASAVNCTL